MKAVITDLWSFLAEPIDGFWDGVIRVILWVCFLGITFLILWGIFSLLDSCGRPEKEGYGEIIGKYYHEPYTTTTFIKSGDVNVPITTFHPERWSVDITVDGSTDGIDVSESYYNSATDNQQVYVSYVRGRISNKLYIKSINQ